MPDGSPGFSLLIIITAESVAEYNWVSVSPCGVGGLIGLTRTMLL